MSNVQLPGVPDISGKLINEDQQLRSLLLAIKLTLERITSRETGTKHEYVDQSVVTGSAPELLGTNITELPITGILASDKSGVDLNLVTGTSGSADEIPKWNADGDIIGSGVDVVNVAGDNHIVNGDMDIWQRGISFAAPSFTQVAADQFTYVKVGAMLHTVSRSTDVPTLVQSGHQSNYSLLMDVTTPDTSIAAGDFTILINKLEGYDYANLVGKTVTLSFWVKAYTTGTYCLSLRCGSTDASYIAEYTINDSLTWEKKEITITLSESVGTWDHINGSGLEVTWAIACGSTYHAVADTWVGTNSLATSNQVNGVADATNDVFHLAQVKLEIGSVATPFFKKSHALELEKCQRYYEKSYNIGKYPGEAAEFPGATQLNTTNGASTDPLYQMSFFTVRKRAIPTVTLWDPAGTINTVFRGAAGKAAAVTLQGQEGFLGGTADATSATYMIYQWVAEASL